jgi:DNA-binding NtrC family response regulator
MFSREAMSALLNHGWPGNVRELENVVERAVVFTTGPVVERKHIVLSTSRDASLLRPVEPFSRAKARVVEEFEKDYVERLLRVNSGNLSRAAREAHKHRRAFWELVRKHRIDVNSLRNIVPQQ